MECAGKNVLVTGAGGYIGSALAKAIAASGPRVLTLLDLSERNLFEVRGVLNADFPGMYHRTVVGSVNDSALMDSVMSECQTQIVFHAAAFKHVELMELNPFAALLNNAVGTFTLAQAAARHGCESLVLISTDKAVRPHSVMGVSKRVAELVAVSLSRPESRMNVIRLCNVRGSTGSVIPIFLEQIARGKPLTITDPNASRSFMSLDGAVTAILAAAVCRLDGRILIPPFGPPVRIADLARSLVNGRGAYPFEVVGLRPGEKVSEDIVGPNETEDEAFQGSPVALRTPKLLPAECGELVQGLVACIAKRDLCAALDLLRSSVPEYVPSELMSSRVQAPGKL